jgi:polysaccharide export outer membrane protein
MIRNLLRTERSCRAPYLWLALWLVASSSGATLNGEPNHENDLLVPSTVSIEPEDIDPRLFFKAATKATENYPLGPEDVVEIRVFELEKLDRTVRVAGDGSIDLPLVGKISVQGLTADGVSERIAGRLRGRYVKSPQVTVFIKEYNSQKVSLLGAVARPATYPLIGRRNLLQVIADAGGLGSAGNILYVFRQTEDGLSARLTVPLNDLLIHGDPRWNICLEPGDVISVPPEKAVTVSVLGAVNDPGIHKLPAGAAATLLKAIALAGGLSERGSKSGILIKRSDPSGEETILKADLGDILSGKATDILLENEDVVLVKESFF